MSHIFIGLGSNIGDRLQHLRDALYFIHRLESTRLVAVSSLYETPPLGFTEQESFYNAVCQIDTTLDPLALLQALKSIERQLGRPEKYERWHPRPIDLDILLYDTLVFQNDIVTIPHIELPNRKFALVPLLDIDNPIHPVLKKSISELLAETTDRSDIRQLPERLLEVF